MRSRSERDIEIVVGNDLYGEREGEAVERESCMRIDTLKKALQCFRCIRWWRVQNFCFYFFKIKVNTLSNVRANPFFTFLSVRAVSRTGSEPIAKIRPKSEIVKKKVLK